MSQVTCSRYRDDVTGYFNDIIPEAMHSSGINSSKCLYLIDGNLPYHFNFFLTKKRERIWEKNKNNGKNPCEFLFIHVWKTEKVREKYKNNDKNQCDNQFIWEGRKFKESIFEQNNNFYRGWPKPTPIYLLNWVQNVTIRVEFSWHENWTALWGECEAKILTREISGMSPKHARQTWEADFFEFN